MTLNGHFTLNSVFFVNSSLKFAYVAYTDKATISMERETTNIYACWKFVTCFSGRRLTASMSSTIKQLNEILTAYD